MSKKVVFLPAYSSELNPDELVWNHYKAHLSKRSILTKYDMKAELLPIPHSIQKQTALVRSFFRIKETQYICDIVA